MKLALSLLFLTSVIYSNEIQRIESIVEDISNLRTSYEKCKKDLKDINPHAINKEVIVIKNDINECSNYVLNIKNNNKKLILLKKKNIELKDKISKNQNMIEKQKNLLKTKEKTISSLENRDNNSDFIIKNKYLELLKTKENEINSLKNRIKESKSFKNTKKLICTETNQFPTLVMKKEYQKTDEKITYTVASVYRLLKDSSIYSSINGNIVESWEKQTSFTSTKESLNWIKITGFFVNKKWQKANRNLWVKKSNTIKREKR